MHHEVSLPNVVGTISHNVEDYVIPNISSPQVRVLDLSGIENDDVRLAVEHNLCMNCRHSLGCDYKQCLEQEFLRLAPTIELDSSKSLSVASSYVQSRTDLGVTFRAEVTTRDNVITGMRLLSTSPSTEVNLDRPDEALAEN